MLRALILDLGEVLVHPQTAAAVARMAALAGVPAAAFREAYWATRDAYDTDGDAGAYWGRVLAACGCGGGESGALAEALLREDVASWSVTREPMWELAERARSAGLRTALLSNCGPEIIDRVREERDFSRYFDEVVVSSAVGLIKPDPAIFRLTVERLGVAPGQALFVDDRTVNVAAAASVGLQTLHFTGEASIAELERLLEPALRVAR